VPTTTPSDGLSYTGGPIAICGPGVGISGTGTVSLVISTPSVGPSAATTASGGASQGPVATQMPVATSGTRGVVACAAIGGAAPGETNDGLASTGFPTGEVVAGGLILLAAGLGLSLLAARRRPRRAS
jgi:hypothetical protein